LEDGILHDLIRAVHEKRQVSFTQQSTRYAKETIQLGVPLQVFVSVQSGRRYVCLYVERNRRFHNFRLDYIKKVTLLEHFSEYDNLRSNLENVKPFCWGVSFGASERKQTLRMTLYIDEEKEKYVLERLRREGRGGKIERIEQDTFLYTATLYDITEMMAWIKSFTGRILSLEGSNREAIDYFYRDMERMAALYGGEC
jgi:predicted DNA-binding transcriptional regulator YafY